MRNALYCYRETMPDMHNKIRFITLALPALVSFGVMAADGQDIQAEAQLFFSSDVGRIVSVILLLLLLLWLILPLAVFGIKRKLNNLIRQNTESNKLLAEIKGQVDSFSLEDNTVDEPELVINTADEHLSEELVDEMNRLSEESRETNRLLTEIRDVLAALNTDEASESERVLPDNMFEKDNGPAQYDEIKFDP